MAIAPPQQSKCRDVGVDSHPVRMTTRGDVHGSWAAQILASTFMAIHEINNKTDGIADEILPSTRLLVAQRDPRCDADYGRVAAFELMYQAFDGQGCDVVLGATCSGASITGSQVAAFARVPLVSHSSTSPALSGSSHPFFARVVGSDAFQSVGIAQVVSRLLGFRRVATVACSDAYCVSGMAAFHDAARAQGVAVLATAAFSTEQQNLSTPLTILHASGASVFVVFAAQPQDASRLLEQAQAHGIVGDGALPHPNNHPTPPCHPHPPINSPQP